MNTIAQFKGKKQQMTRTEYIEKYILPYADDKTNLSWYRDNDIDYDNDYIEEHRQFNHPDVIITDNPHKDVDYLKGVNK